MYCCHSASNAQTLVNCPFKFAFKLIVERVSGDDRIVSQKIFSGNYMQFIPYIRTRDSAGGWGEWHQLASKSDLSLFGNPGSWKIVETNIRDLNNPPNALILHTDSSPNIVGYPSGLAGNTCVVLQVLPGGADYSAQLAFSFGLDKMAIRRKSGSTTWTAWKYFTAS